LSIFSMIQCFYSMEQSQGNDINKLIIGSVISVLLIVVSLFAAFRFSQSQKSEIVLPGGVTYLGPTNTPVPNTDTNTTRDHPYVLTSLQKGSRVWLDCLGPCAP
jgi:hypothetical protein